MKLLFKNEIIQLDEQLNVENVIEKINELLNGNYYFSHFIADNKVIYEDHENFLQAHLYEIMELEIVVKSIEEFVNDILLSAESYIVRAKSEIGTLIDEFYQNPSSESWNKFASLLEGVQWLNQMIHTIDSVNDKPINWMEYINIRGALEKEIKNLEEAVLNKDGILIADLINFEILPIFESLHSEIQMTIDTEGYRHDLN